LVFYKVLAKSGICICCFGFFFNIDAKDYDIEEKKNVTGNRGIAAV
jgi:hypothetical protein